MTDIYRKNAAAVVFNKDKKVLMCKRTKGDKGTWQFPQGGMEPSETPIEAAARELYEETHISSIKLIKALSEPLFYDFPPDLDGWWKKHGSNYKGQEQYWSLFFFLGEDSDIKFDTTDQVEFKEYKWVDIKQAADDVWKPKEEVYKKVIEFFEPEIRNFK